MPNPTSAFATGYSWIYQYGTQSPYTAEIMIKNKNKSQLLYNKLQNSCQTQIKMLVFKEDLELISIIWKWHFLTWSLQNLWTRGAQSLSKTEALRCRPSTPTAFPLLHESQWHLLKERSLTLDLDLTLDASVKEYFITAHVKPATSVVSNN